jgi:hypothetical protein
MTVIFAFADPARRIAFMGSDDLESHGRVSVDKILVVNKRFFIAGVGIDIPFLGAKCLEPFGSVPMRFSNNDVWPVPTTIEECCTQIATTIPHIAMNCWRGFQKGLREGTRTQEQLQALTTTQRGKLVVLDVASYRIAYVDFGVIYYVKNKYAPKYDRSSKTGSCGDSVPASRTTFLAGSQTLTKSTFASGVAPRWTKRAPS